MKTKLKLTDKSMQEIARLESQKQDFIKTRDELASKPQTEETREKIWELAEIINSIQEDIQRIKERSTETK